MGQTGGETGMDGGITIHWVVTDIYNVTVDMQGVTRS